MYKFDEDLLQKATTFNINSFIQKKITHFINQYIYIIQKKVIRMFAFANYNTPSIDKFKNLNIYPLDKLVVDRTGIMYK